MATDGVKQPHELWQMAHAEHPDDPEARREFYIDLMRVWGHIVPKGDQPAFTCGDSILEWIGDE